MSKQDALSIMPDYAMLTARIQAGPGRQPEDLIKQSNPKDAIGVTKSPSSTVSQAVMAELGCAMLEGSLKYGRHNYRAIGVRMSVYYDACRRHLDDWWEGQDTDPDSGLSHLVKAMACLCVIRDAELAGKVHDDRPPMLPEGWRERVNEHVKRLLAKYPEPKEPWTESRMVGQRAEQEYLATGEEREQAEG